MSPLWWPLNQFMFYCFRIVFVQFIYRTHVHLDHHGEGGGVGDPETLSAIFVANFRMGTKIQGGKGIILTNLSRVSPFKEFHKTWPFVQWMKKIVLETYFAMLQQTNLWYVTIFWASFFKISFAEADNFVLTLRMPNTIRRWPLVPVKAKSGKM